MRCNKVPLYIHISVWFRTAKNSDVSTGPFAPPFAHSLAPLISLPSSWESEWLDISDLGLFWTIVRCIHISNLHPNPMTAAAALKALVMATVSISGAASSSSPIFIVFLRVNRERENSPFFCLFFFQKEEKTRGIPRGIVCCCCCCCCCTAALLTLGIRDAGSWRQRTVGKNREVVFNYTQIKSRLQAEKDSVRTFDCFEWNCF